MKRIIALCAALLWLGGANAYAQDADHAWGTPGGAIVNGAIGMCLNSSGLAIPIGANCVPAGTVTPSNTSAAPLYVTPGVNATWAATESGVWAVTPTVPAASTMNLTSTTTAYTAGQLVANNGTAGSITNPSFAMPALGGAIPRLRLYSDDTGTGWQGATVQIDLWSASPTWTNGDHAAWKPATGSTAHLASYSCSFPSAVWGDGLATECTINQGNYASVIATTIYWSVEVTAASGNVVTASQHLNLRPELN